MMATAYYRKISDSEAIVRLPMHYAKAVEASLRKGNWSGRRSANTATGDDDERDNIIERYDPKMQRPLKGHS